jgi:acetolactate synthase I/III small subunit
VEINKNMISWFFLFFPAIMQCFLRTANPMRVQQQVRSYSAQLALKKRRKQLPWVDTTPTPSVEEAVNNILYNTIQVQPGPLSRHLLNCLVSNEPGVLSRISGIISSRGFNIDSLVVSKTEVQDLSRMTIVLNGKPEIVEQAKKQLEDLVPVWYYIIWLN